MLSNPTEQLLTFRRSRSPDRLEVSTRAASILQVGVDLAVGAFVEVKVWLVPQVEVGVSASTGSHVDETVDGAQGFDELGVRHPVAVVDTSVSRERSS